MVRIYHVLAFPSLYSLMEKENFVQTQCLLTGKVTGLHSTQFTVYCARFHNNFKGIWGRRTWAAESVPRVAETPSRHLEGMLACCFRSHALTSSEISSIGLSERELDKQHSESGLEFLSLCNRGDAPAWESLVASFKGTSRAIPVHWVSIFTNSISSLNILKQYRWIPVMDELKIRHSRGRWEVTMELRPFLKQGFPQAGVSLYLPTKWVSPAWHEECTQTKNKHLETFITVRLYQHIAYFTELPVDQENKNQCWAFPYKSLKALCSPGFSSTRQLHTVLEVPWPLFIPFAVAAFWCKSLFLFVCLFVGGWGIGVWKFPKCTTHKEQTGLGNEI